jgi:pyruvate kinase
MRRKAKIAATLGPASDVPAVLDRMVRGGLDVARLNMSHGDADDHRRRALQLRQAAKDCGRTVGLLADLQGPRFRVGRLEGGTLELRKGQKVELLAGRTRCEAGKIPVVYASLAADVQRGDPVLIDDGTIELKVTGKRDRTVRCTVLRGGVLSDGKGINLPGSDLSAPALTPKDRRDLQLAVEIGADWLAMSFVRRAADIHQARRLLKKAGSDMPIMAKIERPEGITNLDEILEASDGVLVARGDLGVELPTEDVPILQKQIIEAANRIGKPVMTATQMLDSMRYNARPTRAEASDVANAVLDGSGCLLLTAETAVGAYPVEAVKMMARIILRAETSGRTQITAPPEDDRSLTMATCLAGCQAAARVEARRLVVFTTTGFSAQQTARFRPETPLLAYTPSASVGRRLALYWGVQPHHLPARQTIEVLMVALDRALLKERLAKKGDTVVVLSGSPIGMAGKTNLMKLHRVGDALA